MCDHSTLNFFNLNSIKTYEVCLINIHINNINILGIYHQKYTNSIIIGPCSIQSKSAIIRGKSIISIGNLLDNLNIDPSNNNLKSLLFWLNLTCEDGLNHLDWMLQQKPRYSIVI